jgi:DNA-binding PadR family transcriptional regulator
MNAARRPRVLTLSPKESLILQLLVRDEEAYGLELVTASRGRLKRGTVYVTLGRMEDKGYITSRLTEAPPEAGGLPRRVYTPTPLGRQVLDAWSAPVRFLVPAVIR